MPCPSRRSYGTDGIGDVRLLLAAGSSNTTSDLVAWTAFIVALGGTIGAIAGFIGQWRRGSMRRQPQRRPEVPDAGYLWAEMLEQLEAANERADHAEKQLELCNRERLALLRDAARRRK